MRWMIVLAMAVLVTGCIEPLAEDATGEEIYQALCARCHGSDLGGGVGPALGSGSDLVDRPDDYVVATIANGRGRMPQFRTSLSEPQIERVASYLREQQSG